MAHFNERENEWMRLYLYLHVEWRIEENLSLSISVKYIREQNECQSDQDFLSKTGIITEYEYVVLIIASILSNIFLQDIPLSNIEI